MIGPSFKTLQQGMLNMQKSRNFFPYFLQMNAHIPALEQQVAAVRAVYTRKLVENATTNSPRSPTGWRTGTYAKPKGWK